MVHICTIHWKTTRWIDVQLKYLKRFLSCDYKVWACLDGISKSVVQHHRSKFHFCQGVFFKRLRHQRRLDDLAKRVCESACDDDLLVFLDGDAFPIDCLNNILQKPLVAIRRAEPSIPFHPHPAFCLMKVGFWKEIGGTWSIGRVKFFHKSSNRMGSSVGSILAKTLSEKGVSFYELKQTWKAPCGWNSGVFGGVIYHQGAAFHGDRVEPDRRWYLPAMWGLIQKYDDFWNHFDEIL